MANESKKKAQEETKKMAKLIFYKKTEKDFVYNFKEDLMLYEKAIEKAKEITK